MIASDLAYRIAAYAVSRRMRYWYARTRNAAYTVYGARRIRIERECCLEFIGTQFSILYTSMHSLYVYGAVYGARRMDTLSAALRVRAYAIRVLLTRLIRYTRTRNAHTRPCPPHRGEASGMCVLVSVTCSTSKETYYSVKRDLLVSCNQ